MASLNLNKVILGGRLTADPELKQTTSGITVCSFSIAVNRKMAKDKEREADFINCTAWRSTAEFISKYFKKGSSICVVGSIQTRSWEDNEGQKRYATEVVVEEAMFVDSKAEAQGAAAQYTPEAYSAPTLNPQSTPKFEEVEDDSGLPF